MDKVVLDGFVKVNQSEQDPLKDRSFDLSFADEFDFESEYAVASSRAVAEGTTELKIEKDRLVQVVFSDDSELYLTPEEVERLSGAAIDGASSRGLKEVVFKLLRIFKVKEKAVDITADKFLDSIEQKLERTLGDRPEGLYQLGFLAEKQGHKSEADYAFSGRDDTVSRDNNVVLSLSQKPLSESSVRQSMQWGLPQTASDAQAKPPLLVFIHGTFSSTTGSFGGLGHRNNRDILLQLRKDYQNRIYSLQHRSLSNSPVRNAINLVKALPNEAEVHLVSHSRGGLVGELVALGNHARYDQDPINLDQAKELYAIYGTREEQQDAASGEVDELVELNRLLVSKRLNVSSFVRCACPIRGTSLLKENKSGKNDGVRILSSAVVQTMRGMILSSTKGTLLSPLLEFGSSVLGASFSKLKDISSVPGLAAMSPTSPLVALLNSDQRKLDSHLSIVAGDSQAGLSAGIKQNAGRALTYLFFRQDNDFVVDTKFMFGGANRKKNASWYVLEENSTVNHFSYFDRSQSARRVFSGLGLVDEIKARDEDVRQLGDYRLLKQEDSNSPEVTVRQADNLDGPVVFLLPGIMGSYLDLDGKMIWVHYWRLLRGKLTRLKINQSNVTASGIHKASYAKFANYLRQDNEVVEFPFDWRLPIEVEAMRLAERIVDKFTQLEKDAKQRHKPMRPIRIIGHSMGGLVARSLMFVAPELWTKLVSQDQFRFLMLGTPNQGAHAILRAYTGHNPIVSKVAGLDLAHSKKEITSLISHFPGVANLIPYSEQDDWFDFARWEKMRDAASSEKSFSIPSDEVLSETGKFYKKLLEHPLGSPDLQGKVIYVAGKAQRTATGMVVNTKGEIEFTATDQGDGSVTWDSGIPDGVSVFYAVAEHGLLAAKKDYFKGYSELLNTGDTRELDRDKPESRGGGDVPNIRADDDPIDVPTINSIEDLLGGNAEEQVFVPVSSESQIKLTVRHGNLKFVKGDVAVGHYVGDSILGAEKDLDVCLDGVLSQSRELNSYPGKLRTVKYFSAPSKSSEVIGGLVVGLGRVGDLSGGALKSAFTAAVVQYLEAKQLAANDPAVKLSTLLIGSGLGGVSVTSCVNGLLEGVKAANSIMHRAASVSKREQSFISEIEIVELYQDTAIETLHSIKRVLNQSLELRNIYRPDYKLYEAEGHRERVHKNSDDDWWRRLDISRDADGTTLKFKLVGDSSGAFIITRQFPKAFLETVIAEALSTTYWDKQTAVKLFECLLPKQLKEYAFDEQNLLIVVDEETAAYPWELMEDRLQPQTIPLGVRVGLIRQLADDTNQVGADFLNRDEIIIIGDPELDSREDQRDENAPVFRRLKGAKREAEEVKELFEKNGYKAHSAIGKSFDKTINTLVTNDCKVLHLAGHGIHEVGEDALGNEVIRSGLVLNNGQFINADLIKEGRFLPELVFINCCHLGDLSSLSSVDQLGEMNKMAASISRELIRLGVKAVVAAGWAVDDDASYVFAKEFYSALLERHETFGEAVIAARKATHEFDRYTNTWGAYQCYGDPSYRFISAAKTSNPTKDMELFTVAEAVAALKNLVSDIRSSGRGAEEYVKQVLIKIEDIAMQRDWSGDASYLVAVGLVWGELHYFEIAISYLEQAVSKNMHKVNYRATDELNNFKARHAAQLIVNNPESKFIRDNSIKSINEALSYFEQQLKLRGEDEKLHAYIGSTRMRLCVALPSKAKSNLMKMSDSYEKAIRLSSKRHMENEKNSQSLDSLYYLGAYPTIRFITSKLLSYWRYKQNAQGVKELELLLHKLSEQVEHREKTDINKSFWAVIQESDLEVARLLLREGDVVEAMERLEYSKNVGSKRQYASIRDNLNFIMLMLDTDEGLKDTSAVRDRVIEISKFIEQQLA